MKHFHGTYKDVCDKYDPEWYGKFKTLARTSRPPCFSMYVPL